MKQQRQREFMNIAFGDSSLKKTQVFERHKSFKEGKEGTGDDERFE